MSETISDRELDARRFAEAVVWDYFPRDFHTIGREFFAWGQVDGEPAYEGTLDIPAPDAPLHEHLAFVGRVAEVCPNASVIVFAAAEALMRDADMSHAALLAALAALGAGAGK